MVHTQKNIQLIQKHLFCPSRTFNSPMLAQFTRWFIPKSCPRYHKAPNGSIQCNNSSLQTQRTELVHPGTESREHSITMKIQTSRGKVSLLSLEVYLVFSTRCLSLKRKSLTSDTRNQPCSFYEPIKHRVFVPLIQAGGADMVHREVSLSSL